MPDRLVAAAFLILLLQGLSPTSAEADGWNNRELNFR